MVETQRPSREDPPGRSRLRAWRAPILGLVGLVVLHAVPWPRGAVESWYGRTIYPGIASAVVPIGGAWPGEFPLGALLLAAGVLGALAWTARSAWRARGRGRVAVSELVVRRALGFGVLAAWWFTVVWGGNYRREPLCVSLGVDVRPLDEARIEHTLRGLEAVIHRDAREEEFSDVRASERRAVASVRASMLDLLARAWGADVTLPARVDRLPEGWFLAAGTKGMMFPLLLEPVVDGALEGADLVKTAAHELAHVAGVADEGDAELLGILAGLAADDPLARYSAALAAWRRLVRQLRDDEQLERWTRLPPVALRDLEAMARVTRQHVIPAVSRVQSAVYERYLTSQGVKEGLRSYSASVERFVAAIESGWAELPTGDGAGGPARVLSD